MVQSQTESTMRNVATQFGAFIQFATAVEQSNAATSLAEKAALLGRYLMHLPDDQLLHAVHYLMGQTPATRDRPPQIGEMTLIAALSILSGAEPALLTAKQKELEDLGAVAASVLLRQTQPVLTLDDVAIALEQLNKAKGKRKLAWVVRLLERATALEANYLSKLLLGMPIEPEVMVEAAIAQMSRQPRQQIQRVHILLGDLGKTAILARHRQLDQACMQLFHPIKFMLASSVPDPVQLIQQLPQGYAVEAKYDGLRAQVHIAPADKTSNMQQETVFSGIRVALFSRTLQEITAGFPDLVAPLAALTPNALVKGESAGLILDGEILAYQDGQFLPFAALQPRLNNSSPTAALLANVPVAFMIYDVLYQDGTVLLDQPYTQRRTVLEALPIEAPQVQLASSQPVFELETLEQQYIQARLQGQEGLMLKALASPYRPNRRSRDWLKLKQTIATLDVVITAAELDPDDASGFSTYAIAVRTSETDPALVSVGKVAAGLGSTEQQQVSNWLQHHIIEEFANGRVWLVEPQIILEVMFDRLQPSSRHKSGYVLEAPRILRIRQDKPLEQIDTLQTVQHLSELQTEPWWDKAHR